MALVTRTLSNEGAPLCAPDGTVLANVRVTFTLVDSVGEPTDAWDSETEERVVGSRTTTTDNAGEFSVDLWPNSRGTSPTYYRCAIAHRDAQDISAAVAAGESTLTWLEFMAEGRPMSGQELTALQLHLNDDEGAHPASSISAEPPDGYTSEDVQGLLDELAARVDEGGGPGGGPVEIADVTGLQDALDGKATAAQGAKADSAVQPADLSGYATTASLGTASTFDVPATGNAANGEVVKGSDTRLSDTRTPTDASVTEDKLSLSDVTTGNASTSKHGLLPKLSGSSSDVLKGDGTFGAASGGSPGGSDGQVQVKDGTAFAGGPYWNATELILALGGLTSADPGVRKGSGSRVLELVTGDGSQWANVKTDGYAQLGALVLQTYSALRGGDMGSGYTGSLTSNQTTIGGFGGNQFKLVSTSAWTAATALEYLDSTTALIGNGSGSPRDLKLRGLWLGEYKTVGTLPSAAAMEGMQYDVNDLDDAAAVGDTAAAGGTRKGCTRSNGSAWKVTQVYN